MAGPQNGIVGEDFGTDIPVTDVPEQDLTVEKNMARFSKTSEFKKLKEYIDQRVVFYQNYFPDGRDIKSTLPTANDWVIANAVIGELKAIISAYDQANEVVESVQRKGA